MLARVCISRLPPKRAPRHSGVGQSTRGMNVLAFTSWYTSAGQVSHVYVATWTSGFTSVTRVTMARSETSCPIEPARIWRTDSGLAFASGRIRSS